jgi:putative endonuclease
MRRSLPCCKCLKTKGNRRRISGRTSVNLAEQFDSPHQRWWGSFLVGFAHCSFGALTNEVSRTALSEGAPHIRPIICEGRLSRRARPMPSWFYILRLRSTHLYCGSTRFLDTRIKHHFAGRACRTTKIDPPIALVYSEQYPSYKEAFRREHQVKHWSRANKEALISGKLSQRRKLAKRKRS